MGGVDVFSLLGCLDFEVFSQIVDKTFDEFKLASSELLNILTFYASFLVRNEFKL